MCWHFLFFRIFISSARMTPVRNSLRTQMPEKASAVVLAFFMPKKPSCFWNTFLERRKPNEKTNPSALAQKSVQTCCVQAAGEKKGGKKACKVPAENGICPSRKALSASESRCIICRIQRVPTNRWFWLTRQICQRRNGWNIAADGSAEVTPLPF